MTIPRCTHGVIVVLLLVNLTVPSAAAQEDAAVDSGATNYAHRPNTVLKTADDTLVVHTAGSGEIPVVLIPGHMQDESMYASLIERHEAAAEYHVVIPPGMAGTPAYPWPDDAEEFIARPWSTRFEEELVRYIDEDLESRVIYDAEAQRERLGRTIDFWRTVDEFTWHSNMFPAPFHSNDQVAGLRAVYEEAKSPMPVGLGYFAEYMMDDLTGIIPNVDVPVHVISTIPPEEYYRTRFRDPTQLDMDRVVEGLRALSRNSWQVGDNPVIDVTVIAETGLMVWHDRPDEFDGIFLRALGGRTTEEDRPR